MEREWIDRQYTRPSHPAILTWNQYARRVKQGPNRMGAAYRLCTVTQPSSRLELVLRVWPSGTPPGDVFDALVDGYEQWLAAGKPPAHPVRPA